MGAPDFWDEPEAAQKTAQAVTQLKAEVETVYNLEQRLDDLEVMVELALEEPDSGMEDELASGLEAAKAEIEHLELGMLLNGEYDANNAILTLHAGAGGTEAQDWTSMLLRMFTRYAEREGFQIEMLDYLPGDEAGVKSATLQINGHNAYGYLRSEKGVHRLVRISPFDANARTSSAVRMTHIPTGIIVQCQNERSQIQNRERCMQLLRAKLYEFERAKQEALKNDIAGDYQEIEWGSQIRSYVFQPYKLVKDHRTGAETGNVQAVMDGGIDLFIEAYLRSQQKKL